jgi:hypothetical protein
MPQHFLLRVGDGIHFTDSSKFKLWGVNSKDSPIKGFLKSVKVGDVLWFVKGKSKGQLISVATFTEAKQRILGPLIPLTLTNEQLGWTKTYGDWDTEIHYDNLYNISMCELYSEIKSPLVIRLYSDKCKVNLPEEYSNIIRYSKVTNSI